MSLFFSYSSKDDSVARRVVNELKRSGIDIWFAPREIPGGSFYADKLVPSIRACEALLLLASRNSIGHARSGLAGSRGVRREVILADQCEKRIVPLAIDDALVDGCEDGFRYMIAERQWVDLRPALSSGRFAEVCREVANALKEVGAQGVPTAASRLAQAEAMLKRRRHEQALTALPSGSLQAPELNRAILLQTIAQLQKRGVSSLTLSEAESLVSRLRGLCDTAEAPPALYLLAILSRHWFAARSMVDITGGYAALKRQAHRADRLRPADLNMIRPMLPSGSRIELDWIS